MRENTLNQQPASTGSYWPRLCKNRYAEGRFGKQDFIYVADDDEYRCPAGHRLIRRFDTVEQGMTLQVYWSSTCQGCAIKAQCTLGPQRRIRRWEPEEVMGVLGEYHRVMGQLIMAHEGTLERFAGDGFMIFFNDPIKLENPTANAVKMALEMQEHFVPLRAAWKKRGYGLDLGIGIAQGYATLGAIGFEGRWDYACIGSVTNLAARLCSEAKGGQVLTNQKTLGRIEDAVQAEPLGEVTLKGIAHPVPVFNVTAFKS